MDTPSKLFICSSDENSVHSLEFIERGFAIVEESTIGSFPMYLPRVSIFIVPNGNETKPMKSMFILVVDIVAAESINSSNYFCCCYQYLKDELDCTHSLTFP